MFIVADLASLSTRIAHCMHMTTEAYDCRYDIGVKNEILQVPRVCTLITM